MSTLDTLIERNQALESKDVRVGLPLMPSLRTMIITCADPRVDPAHILGIEPGEVAVIRNVGGRITPGTLQNMNLLQMIGQVMGASPNSEFNLILLHHTDCGITRLESNPDLLAGYFGIDPSELPTKAVSDPYTSIVVDLAVLKASIPLPPSWQVTGMVYNIQTGHLQVIPT
ncbi:MAG TPA: carbonic anhydrase [Aggregatilineales bacterium]|nr:carbonic anhydrase [Aggregatilineales bacterium]